MTDALRRLFVPAVVALSACGGGTVTTPNTPTTVPPTTTPVTTTGTINLTVGGLPTGLNGAITVTGPGSYSSTQSGSATLGTLTTGTYTVAATAVAQSGKTYAPTPASQQVTVAANASVSASVVYAQTSNARLIITTTGLPAGTSPRVVVNGPGGLVDTITTATDTLTNAATGSYTLSATTVASGTTNYTPTPASQTVSVTAGQTTTASIAYAQAGAVSLNLTVDNAYLVQTVQTLGNTVPLVANKAAWIRVFARATEGNTVRPDVRVRLYNGATLIQTYTIPAPGSSTPTTVSEASLNNSWNVAVPANLVQPGLRILADVDPTNAIAEATETDNSYPSNGTPLALTVQTVPTFALRLLSIITRSNNLQGDVSSTTAQSYLPFLRAVWPIVNVDVDVRAPYTTTDTAAITSSNSNGAWGDVLSEIYALRTADSSSRDYYGVLATSYSSGVAGIGYIGAPAAIGWDKTSSRASVLAHELGHNFGRSHAPCGGAANPDPNYPYANGADGVYGLDVATANATGINTAGVLKQTAATDVMGYCGTQWVSDYHYNLVLSFFTSGAAVVSALDAVQPSLIVWGRIANGQVTLEPAFESRTRPALPSGRGAQTLEGLDAAGNLLFSWAFDGQLVDHDQNGARQFAFALPLDDARREQLATLRVRSGGVVAEQRTRSATAGVAGNRSVRAVAGNGVGVSWDAGSYPLAVVRDAVTGEILSLARGGSVTVAAPSGRVRVDVSDGVRSAAADVQ